MNQWGKGVIKLNLLVVAKNNITINEIVVAIFGYHSPSLSN